MKIVQGCTVWENVFLLLVMLLCYVERSLVHRGSLLLLPLMSSSVYFVVCTNFVLDVKILSGDILDF